MRTNKEIDITKNEFQTEKEARQWVGIILRHGYMYHDISTGNDWIGISYTALVYMGKSETDNWISKDTASKAVVWVPSEQGTEDMRLCYVDKITNLRNPYNPNNPQEYNFDDIFKIILLPNDTFAVACRFNVSCKKIKNSNICISQYISNLDASHHNCKE